MALRALSVGAAVATLPVFHALARRLGRGLAFTADLLLAASPFFLTSAPARAYSLAVLLVVLAAWALVRALETDDPRHWRRFVVVAGLALYTQWFSALVIVAFFAAAWMTSRPRRSRRAAAAAVLLLAATPIVVLVLAGDTGGVGWIAPLSVAQLHDLANDLTSTHAVLGQLAMVSVATIGLVAAVRRTVAGARATVDPRVSPRPGSSSRPRCSLRCRSPSRSSSRATCWLPSPVWCCSSRAVSTCWPRTACR